MKKTKAIIHWVGYAVYLYIFGYASLFKVFRREAMMQGMSAFGFDTVATVLIGFGELLGVIGLLAGLLSHRLKNAAILWLFPFAIGALTAHLAHREYEEHYQALACCILSVVLLATDKHFRISL